MHVVSVVSENIEREPPYPRLTAVVSRATQVVLLAAPQRRVQRQGRGERETVRAGALSGMLSGFTAVLLSSRVLGF